MLFAYIIVYLLFNALHIYKYYKFIRFLHGMAKSLFYQTLTKSYHITVTIVSYNIITFVNYKIITFVEVRVYNYEEPFTAIFRG